MRILLGNEAWVAIGLLLCGGVFSTGCERSYGVERRAQVSSMPDPACVHSVFSEGAGIRVHHEWTVPRAWEKQDGRRLISVQVSYHAGMARGIQFAVFDEPPRPIRMIHSNLRIDSIPDQKEVDDARHAMRLMEDALAARCNLPELARNVEESCFGVRCE